VGEGNRVLPHKTKDHIRRNTMKRIRISSLVRLPFPAEEVKAVFSKKSLLVSAALILTSFLGVSAANAQKPQPCYTLASLQGSYAVIGNYGANLAIALGRRQMDGNGNLTGTFLVNEPTPGSPTGARTLVTGTQAGTYTVNCDGTGVVNRTTTLSTGAVSHGTDDFIITGAIVKNGQLIATALVDAQRTPSAIVPGGVFLTRTWTRLPDRDQDADSDDGGH
jgi:hypothetical protein